MVNGAQGRFAGRDPVGIIDIGSNSVRLVVYEGVTRSPWVLFNEKVMCGLGRGIASTGKLPKEGVRLALDALRRFRALATQAQVRTIYPLATAAARDASNGPDFVREAEDILGVPITIVAGQEEARLAALAVTSGFHDADGLVGDLGGGSLELTRISPDGVGAGISLPLGGLRLFEEADGDVKKARKIASAQLDEHKLRGSTFYAVGGTWRALARLNMAHAGYPLHIQQGYEFLNVADFLKAIAKTDPEDVADMEEADDVSKPRRPLLPIGAMLMAEVLERMGTERVVVSSAGVREGFLYDLLNENEKAHDPLLAAAEDLATLNSRDPEHGRELADWTERSLQAFGVEETREQWRARVAACLLTDIAWRANPDYRGAQALRIITFGAFLGADHQTRMMIALSIYFRYAGLKAMNELPDFAFVATEGTMERAKLHGALFRVAYLLSGAQRGIVSRLRWIEEDGGGYALVVPTDASELIGDRPENRLNHLSKTLGLDLRFVIAG